MTTLNGTISFVEMHIIAMSITKYLNLDVSRSGDILFNQNTIVTESFGTLSLATLQSLHELFRRANDKHTLASTTRDSLD